MSLLSFLYQAIASDYGIKLRADNGDAESLRQALYRERKAATDPALDILSLQISPTDSSELWITKRNPDARS